MAPPAACRRVTMGWRGTSLLLLLVVVAAAALRFEDSAPIGPHPAGDSNAARRPTAAPLRPVLALAPDDVVSLRLRCAGGTRLSERRPDGWTAVERPADIDDFLRTVVSIGILADVGDSPAGLAEFGLQTPAIVAEFRLRSRPDAVVLQIGDHNPVMTGVYVRLGAAGPVLLAGSLLRWELENVCRKIAAG